MLSPGFSIRSNNGGRERHGLRILGSAAAAVLLLLFIGGPVTAQQDGTVTGRVVAASTTAPLASAEVYLEGTASGTLTDADGRFLLLNVSPGSYTIVVQRIGYTTARRDITVSAGETETLTFELEEQVLALDEIVVTGQAGRARRREVGNAIEQISMSEITEPPVSMEQLLQGRVTGLTITPTAGAAGAGSMIRLRGNVSVAMSNQPLVYVDGVRVRSDPYPKNTPTIGYSGRSGNVTPSPLNDIDPANIARIEVIKGAAATTLYGTEASAGVIQIFTKSGTRGEAQWSLQIDQGFSWVKPFGTERYPYLRLDPWMRGAPSWLWGGLNESLVNEVNESAESDPRLDPWSPKYPGTAHRQKYYLSVRGGMEQMNYFISGSWEDYESILPNDVEETMHVRGNFGFSPLEGLALQWNTGLAITHIQNTPSGNNAQGMTLQAYRYNRNYVGGYYPLSIDSLLVYDIDTNIAHLVTGLTATYQPALNRSHRIAVGYDRAAMEMRQLRPFGFIMAPDGILANERWTSEIITLDYVGNYSFDLTDALASTVSWGGQLIETEETSVEGDGRVFPGPGEPTISSGAVTNAFEDRIRVINAGFYGQVRVGYENRAFLTAGLRMDGNSAFGSGLGLQPYPKVTLSYVISDAAWWPAALGTMKLRGALGQSGRAPGAFDAVRTWEPVQLGGEPGFFPENLGNDELGPERTTGLELGFDAAFLDGRLAARFTYYRKNTTDALLPVRTIPSQGGWEDQLRNVGELRNSGIELDVSGTVIQRRDLLLDMGVSIFTNHSEVVSLGGAPAFSVGGNAWIVKGHPVPVMRGMRLTNPNSVADPSFQEEYYFGPNQPTLVITPRMSLSFFDGFVLSAYGSYQGGFFLTDGPSANAIGRGVIWPYCNTSQGNASQLLADGQGDGLTARMRFLCNWDQTDDERYIFPADFFKLRNVSLQIPLDAIVPMGTGPTLTLSARNAFRWFNEDWFAFDPEMLSNSGADDLERTLTEHVPPASTFTASLRVNF